MNKTSLACVPVLATVLALGASGAAQAATSGPASTIPGCKVGVWADDYTDAGQLAWQRSLPVPKPYDQGSALTPVVVGGVSVFADGNTLYGLRKSDGRAVWHHAFPNTSNTLTAGLTGIISSLTAWKGSVVVLLGTSSNDPSLVALDAATGAVRWRVPFKGQELEVFAPVVTSDGVAAVVNSAGSVQTFDLAAGKHLWSRTYRKDTVVQAAGSLLVIDNKPTDESPSTLHGVVARTGHTAWTRGGFPNEFSYQSGPDGLVFGYGVSFGVKEKVYPVLALSAATGQTRWQLKPGDIVTAVWPASAGVAVATGDEGSVTDPGGELRLLDPKTGRVRWTATDASLETSTGPVITATNVTTVTGKGESFAVVDRGAATGAVRWRSKVTSNSSYRYLVQPKGPDLLVLFLGTTYTKPERLEAVDVATGKLKTTDLLPPVATVGAPPAVTGSQALLEPEVLSCAPPVHP